MPHTKLNTQLRFSLADVRHWADEWRKRWCDAGATVIYGAPTTEREHEIYERRIAKHAEMGAFAYAVMVRYGQEPGPIQKKQKEWGLGNAPKYSMTLLRHPKLLIEQMLALFVVAWQRLCKLEIRGAGSVPSR